MARWITFDQNTAAELRSWLPDQSIFEAPGRSAFEYALSSPGSVVAVLPVTLANCCAVAVFRPPQIYAIPENLMTTRAAGFLGLLDEVVTDEEEVRPRNWWQRLWS